MKKLFYCICAAGLLVLGACGTKNNDKADDAYATDEACAKCTAAGIEGKWVIDEILCGKQFVKPAAENGERMYISFAADSTVIAMQAATLSAALTSLPATRFALTI